MALARRMSLRSRENVTSTKGERHSDQGSMSLGQLEHGARTFSARSRKISCTELPGGVQQDTPGHGQHSILLSKQLKIRRKRPFFLLFSSLQNYEIILITERRYLVFFLRGNNPKDLPSSRDSLETPMYKGFEAREVCR